MRKSVLISIQPYWVFLIIAKAMGWNIYKEKTVEVRKTFPKDEGWNEVAKIYCSKDKKSFAKIPKEYQPFMKPLLGKVVGEFVCDGYDEFQAEFTDLMYFDSQNENVCQNTIKRVAWLEDENEPYYFYETANDEDNPNDCELLRESCLTFDEIRQYIGETFYDKYFYGWKISDLVIYDKPKELSEFKKINQPCWYGEMKISKRDCHECKSKDCFIQRPPQSWCYVKEV